MFSNLTNYRNCALYCEYTLAHALKSVVNIRCMLEITASLTLLACQTVTILRKTKKENTF